MFDVDTKYYDNDLLQKLIPGLPPRIEIGFYYPDDLEGYDALMAEWKADGSPDPDKYRDGWGYDFEDWMPLANGYWDTIYPTCVNLISADGRDSDCINYDYCSIGPSNDVEWRKTHKYTRSDWLREVLDYLEEDIIEWEWTPESMCYRTCDNAHQPHAFVSPAEMYLYKDYFLNWYEEWVKQGRPVRALSFDGDTDHPVFGELEYEER